MTKTKSFYKCQHCGDEIAIDTGSKLISCRCGKLGVDGNEHYVRIIGEEGDFELVEKQEVPLANYPKLC